MLEVMRRLHTKDQSELIVRGSPEEIKRAMDVLRPLKVLEVKESIPWREAFPPLNDATLPGVVLAGGRAKEGLTQHALASMTGIPQRHLSEMENGKRPIDKERARTLGKVLKLHYNVFL